MRTYVIPKEITGTEIKGLRKRLELTQAEFAKLVNVSLKTIERWEAGEKGITGPIVTMIRILEEYPQLDD